MSIAQTTRDVSPSSDPHCPHCNAPLPPSATFCTACGERVVTQPASFRLQEDANFPTRYRITSLVRRRPYVSLLFAVDTQLARPVAIRDIDITSLDDAGRLHAFEIVQQEYDLLRRQRIPSVMPAIDLRHFDGHLYLISSWPLTNHETGTHLFTLQDVLQSGIGLPDTSLSLAWGEQLSLSLHQFHQQHIILSDLDPQTLILSDDQYTGSIQIMISWLPFALYDLFLPTSTFNTNSNYTALEVLSGKPEPRSDIYSIGAVLYLLLTGVPPLDATARSQRRLRPPSELNPRLNGHIDELIMKAVAIDSSERFPDASSLAEALARQLNRKRPFTTGESIPFASAGTLATPLQTGLAERKEPSIDDIINTDTVAITPLPEINLTAWQSANSASISDAPVLPSTTARIVDAAPIIIESSVQQPAQNRSSSFSDAIDEADIDELPLPQFNNSNSFPNPKAKATRSLRQRITGILPAISRSQLSQAQPSSPARPLPEVAKSAPELALRQPTTKRTPTAPLATTNKPSFIKQLQHVIMGEQKHVTTAAAIIETPLRVQPQQTYSIRIQLLGRDTPFSPNNNGAASAGLSALTEGALVRIEVRSALYQSYAYIVQQATVAIPAAGYAAEVTIPMKPLSNGPSGRRDRLHIFFMDEFRRPLYEKPFIVELFISHLVQPGREGHSVLTIPL